MKFTEVIIIGAGPAGISTAIQLKRYGIKPLVIEKNEMGGLLHNANLVENYPGFPNGVTGKKLIKLFKKQFDNFNIEIIKSEVVKIEVLEDQLLIKTKETNYLTNCLVVASGTKPNKYSEVHIPKKAEPFVHYEVSKLLDENGKNFVIIGAGDASFDYAINLSKNNEVIILNRSDEIRCLPLLLERVEKNKSIKYYSNSGINGINWDGFNLEISIEQYGVRKKIISDHLIFAIGRQPELEFMDLLEKSIVLELIKQEKIIMVGDVKNNLFRQTSISVGDGVMAAMKIYKNKQESKI